MAEKEKVSGKALKRILFLIILAYAILFIGSMISFYLHFLSLLLIAIDIVLMFDISKMSKLRKVYTFKYDFQSKKRTLCVQ